MTSDLTAARTALAALLNTITGVRAVTVVPKSYTPPIVWVAAASPYRQRGQAVAEKRINLVAVCLGGMSTNDATEEATEELAELVADKIDASGATSPYWRLDPLAEMDQPRLYPGDKGTQVLGIAVNLSCRATRG